MLKEEFKTHFRNVTRIMDCIGCDKCRLWGKVQTTGVATAMKVLFEMDENALKYVSNLFYHQVIHTVCRPYSNVLQRSELVALINTLYRFSESLDMVNRFRQQWAEISATETQALIKEASKAADAPVSSAGSQIHLFIVSQQSGFSPPAGSDQLGKDKNFIQATFDKAVHVCRKSTLDCLTILLRIWGRGRAAFSSVFTPSGKEFGPIGNYEHEDL